MEIIGFIFDLDGTLVDSQEQIENCLNKARIDLGYKESQFGYISNRLGLPIKELVSDLDLIDTQLEELVTLFRQYLILEIQKVNKVYEGAIEFLHELRMRSYKIAIATSKPTYLAESVVRNSSLFGLVDFTQGTDGFPSKPAPDVILRCIDELRLDKAVMFGDRIEDMQAAIRSRIPCIGIAQSTHSVSDLNTAGASLAFENFADLNSQLNAIESLLDSSLFDK
jgi:phosphoglycolate phosphatase